MDYKSSLNEMDRFLASNVYDDMSNDFDEWLEAARLGLEKAETLSDVYRYQGRVEVIRDILNWFDNFRSILEEEKT